jgi:NADP-dependent 3-hydroxy acid dehydrogenase YdfG
MTPLIYNTAQPDKDAFEEFGGYLKDPAINDQILSTDSIADSVIFALTQPANAAVNEILIEPTTFPI